MAAGKVYPQPYIPVFGNKKKIIFLVGLINFHCRATGLLLLVVIFQLSDFLINSMAPLFKTSNNGACVVIFQLTVEHGYTVALFIK